MSNENRKSALYPPQRPSFLSAPFTMDLQPVSKSEEKDYTEFFPESALSEHKAALEKAETDPAPKTEHQKRKEQPLFRGALAYFPDALAALAELSRKATEQHGQEVMHWDYGRSDDHGDCILRHQTDYDEEDSDGVLHAIKVLWRAAAQAQTLLESRDEALHKRRQAQRDRAKEGKR
jgi:hypothetical protein